METRASSGLGGERMTEQPLVNPDQAPVESDDERDYSERLARIKWGPLVASVEEGTCVPFLGAGVSRPLPTGAGLAATLASACGYPLPDKEDLAQVAQYIATMESRIEAKRRVKQVIEKNIEKYTQLDPGRVPENYRILAALKAPIYITTNYDDFLERAIRAQGREPVPQSSRWNARLSQLLPPFPVHEPDRERPIVFHLHGHLAQMESILVTDDDYIEFLVNFARNPNNPDMIWSLVTRALSFDNVLFIGYKLADVNFRVYLRFILSQVALAGGSDTYMSVQLQDKHEKMSDAERARAVEYLERFYRVSRIDLHWVSADSFLKELARQRGSG